MKKLQTLLLLAAASVGSLAHAQAADGSFTGRIGATRAESTPAFPHTVEAPRGAPNVVVILLDDVGFGGTSTFGGTARTPNLERLAAQGVRYNRFHTTAICSPTRAALLSGRNQHQVGFGNLQDVPAGFPAYNTIWKKETASIARMLKDNGYSTAAFGKWHNTPQWEISRAGPFDRWPTGLGFDRFYGFMGGEDDQWEPRLYDNTTPVAAPGQDKPAYHLTTDLVDKAIGWLDEHDALASRRPYFLYFATGAAHQPHHAPREWLERNRGRFDAGWDELRVQTFARQKRLGVVPADAKLTPRPAGLPAWSSLSADQKRVYAAQMETYAAFVEHTDAEVGRLIDAVRSRPGGENTLIFFIAGDNGASVEGGLDGSIANEGSSAAGGQAGVAAQLLLLDKFGGRELANHYAAAWAWATNAPFQWSKQVASHFGGTRNPLVVSWPGHTNAPEKVRPQFGHVNDIAPTILDAAGIAFPDSIDGVKQLPFEGSSLVPSFTDAAAPERHTTQYFEIFGNRAIYKDGWVAAAKRDYLPWNLIADIGRIYRDDTANDRWELYHVAEDFSEAKDLAKAEPTKLAELKAEFDREAWRNGVYPLIPLPFGAPSFIDTKRTSFEFGAAVRSLPQSAVPSLAARAHRVEIELRGDASAGAGVLLADGGRLGGFVLYAKEGRLVFENNVFGQARQSLVASEPLPPGPVTVAYEFVPEPSAGAAGSSALPWAKPAPGVVRLFVDGRKVAEGAVGPFATAIGSFNETIDFGFDGGSPVSDDYAAPFEYSGLRGTTRIRLE